MKVWDLLVVEVIQDTLDHRVKLDIPDHRALQAVKVIQVHKV